jgi:hypothetical protein
MQSKNKINFYISRYSPKEAKKRATEGNDFYVVDISKIIRELGYELDNLSDESEFIINYTIRKKILQGIYSTKCDGILVCYKSLSDDFLENLEIFLDEHVEEFEYTIHSL